MRLPTFLCAAALTLAAQDPSAQAARAMREGRFAEAEKLYRQIIAAGETDPRLYMNLGLALHSERKYREAIDAINRFLKANPQPGPAHLLVGVARLKLNQPCDAVAPLEKARQWQSTNQVLIELADAYSGCKRYLSAAQTYEQAAKAQAANADLKRAAARSYWQAREYEKARPLFTALAAQRASDPEFAYEYGDTLARLDGAAAGLPYLERAVKAAPDLTPARGALGRALVELGRAAQAIPHLEAAAPTDSTLLLPLSRAYKETGRAGDAARVQEEYRRKVGGQN